MKKSKLLFVFLFCILFSFVSCGVGSDESSSNKQDGVLGLMNTNNLEFSSNAPPPPSIKETSETSEVLENIEKKIIKIADITIEIKDLQKSRASIGTMIQKYKAYISEEKETNSTYEISNALTIRILSTCFDSLLNEIGDIAYNIDTKNINLSDVTEEYIDMEARLKNKKEVEKQYLELLKKARTIDEILNVNEH